MSDILSRLSTALADRYRVERELGAGGMATVYLAHDRKHERDVAIKVLHPDLGAALGGERFLSEIRTTARLQHPHILPLLDSGEADGLLFYVMPYIAGETLRARLTREKVLPVAEALRITREIASALDYAHRQQVIHRDIKPENILLHDGSALVADFGIALAVQQAGGARMTQTGLSLGTPQYMSPEQAMGERSIDARSDLYALGAMCYEMLTGDAPFTGNTVQAIVAKVMTEKPVPLRTVRDTVPAHVEQAVLACLAKLPADRPTTAREFAEALGGNGAPLPGTLVSGTQPNAAARTRTSRGVVLALSAVTVASLALAAWSLSRDTASESSATPVRASIEFATEPGSQLMRGEFALSPDGERIVYVVADSTGARRLFLRSLGDDSTVPLAGTEGAQFPMWAPDGAQVAFFADRELRRIALDGGRPQRITTVDGTRYGGWWLRDDLIVFTSTSSPLLQAVAPTGGDATTFADGDVQREVYTGFHVLGDGKQVLLRVLAASDSGSPNVYYLANVNGNRAERVREVKSLRTPSSEIRTILPVGDRYLLVQEGDVLVADADPATWELAGDPVPLIAGQSVGRISASRNGRIVYAMARGAMSNRLLVLNRSGGTVRQLGPVADGLGFDYYGPRLSRDDRSAYYEYHSGKATGDLYRVDVNNGRIVRQTLDETHHNGFEAVGPDERVVFTSTRQGGDLFIKVPDGGPEQRIPLKDDVGFPSDWSPDGRWILFSQNGIGGDIWRTTPTGDSVAPVLNSPASELHAVFSPDGKWIAYASDQQNGRLEIYLRRWPVTNEQWIVSSNGGETPRWRRDGRELFYLRRREGDMRATMVAVPVGLSGPTPEIGQENTLFTASVRPGNRNLRSGVNWDVTSDGQQFVAVVYDSTATSVAPRLQLFINWPAAVRKRGAADQR